MRQLTRATRAYYGLILINFVALMYDASLYLLVTNYVLQRDLSTYLLQKLNVVPGNVHVMYWSTAILYGVLVLRHWNALSVKERYAGFLATLDSTKYQVTQNVETLGQTDIALKQTLKTLQQGNKKFDAIMALDDQSAIGALAALDSLALKDSIPVYGIDGSSDMKKLLLSDPNAKATVAQSPIALGKKVVQTCYQLFDQQKVKKEIIVPVYLLTKDNIKNYDVSGWQ
ncbi:substrate-binding domain-containing protein [Ligilactobacillus murinus]|uniref:substrate-binding domain-containing protein n=1 Tax=Ligilactobacillus murinus TaxID=1622 RepID=UPI001F04A822|nr:substrate-binding domain-containing protein [Ligilactobacillus murinus]